MAKGLLGKKIGMTQIFDENGQVIPVTVIEAGPCRVLQLKTIEKDGYSSIQLGFGQKKQSVVNKPELGHLRKSGSHPPAFVREIRISTDEKYEVGQELKVDIFKPGDYVDITGTSIGKGFQGGMKRWHYSGGPKTHGSMSHRRPGSIGASADPSRVFKGHHMPGRMGGKKKTIQNLKVVRIDPENNLLMVKGAVSGKNNSYLIIKQALKKHNLNETA